jgi:branched-chain amino acid transport system ATP-binding protein
MTVADNIAVAALFSARVGGLRHTVAAARRAALETLDRVGLRPREIDPALELIDSLRRDGLALMMVEHVMRAIMAIADEVLVLHHGVVLTTGKPAAVLSDDRVIEAYLGSRFAERAAAHRPPPTAATTDGDTTIENRTTGGTP